MSTHNSGPNENAQAAPGSSQPSRGGKAVTRILTIVVLLALVGGGAFLWLRRDHGAARQPAGAAVPPPSVTVMAVATREVTPSMNATGRVQAIDKVALRARVSGYLEKKLFNEGADVKAGQLMFVIEKATYLSDVAQTKGLLAAAQADLTQTRLELARQEDLAKRGVAALAKLDEARSKFGQARGDVERQTAALEQANLNLSYTDIKAPISGQVGQITFSVGNYVQQSSGTLATIVSLDPIYATFPVTQRELLEVRRRDEAQGGSGRTATVRLQLADGKLYEHPGNIDFVDVQFNQATDSVTVRAKFPNPDYLLLDGQLVTVVITQSTPVKSIVVPQRALQFDQTGYFVLTVDEQNRAKVTPVGVGVGIETDIQIASGLKEGDRVIVEGAQRVRPQQVVAPVEAKPAATAPK